MNSYGVGTGTTSSGSNGLACCSEEAYAEEGACSEGCEEKDGH